MQAVVITLAAGLSAQCAPQWLLGNGNPGVDWTVFASTAWDPDGAGPETPRVVIGGGFVQAGGMNCNGVAAIDPSAGWWYAFASGLSGTVKALATTATGELVAGGYFSSTTGVAKWNGAAWTSMGSLGSQVECLLRMPNGDLVAGGSFSGALAKWSGSTWVTIGGGITSGPPTPATVQALTVLPNGDLVAGGTFSAAGGVPTNSIARWNGTAWNAMGSIPANNVYALCVLGNGDVVAGCGSGGFGTVQRWNGSGWSPLGSPFGGGVNALTLLPNGDLVATGDFTVAGGAPGNGIARWNGFQWAPLDAGLTSFGSSSGRTLVVHPNGDLVVGGHFLNAGGGASNHVARWTNNRWLALGRGITPGIVTMAASGSDQLVAGGYFTFAGNTSAQRVARWDGQLWQPMGSGTDAPVAAVAVLPNHDVVVGGSFAQAGGTTVNGIARWNGSTWQPLGTGMNGSVTSLALLPNGDLVASGLFSVAGGINADHVARWNGSGWSSVGSPLPNTSMVDELTVTSNGDLVATANNGAAVVSWDGTQWSTLGALQTGFVADIAALPSGGVAIGGFNMTIGGAFVGNLARWNGTNWAAGPTLPARCDALTALPNGDLVAIGTFPSPYNGVARISGQQVSPIGSGITDPLTSSAEATCVLALPNGDLALGGRFSLAGGLPSANFARLRPPCPALTTSVASACVGTLPATTLTAKELPWLGATYRATVLGVAADCLPISVIGFQVADVLLDPVLPFAPAGCVLRPSPDVIRWTPPTAGIATDALAMPVATSLIGLTFHHQYAQLQLDASGNMVGLATSNSLTLTIGML